MLNCVAFTKICLAIHCANLLCIWFISNIDHNVWIQFITFVSFLVVITYIVKGPVSKTEVKL